MNIASKMWLEDMNPRKLSSVQREQKILEIMELFCEENNFDDPLICAILLLNSQIMMRMLLYLNLNYNSQFCK